jgi:hypothetical protein
LVAHGYIFAGGCDTRTQGIIGLCCREWHRRGLATERGLR